MHYMNIPAAALFCLCICAHAPAFAENSSMIDPATFANPPKDYRPSPFWSWNDDLQHDELVRQIEEMKEQE